jgi:hypothetical protein
MLDLGWHSGLTWPTEKPMKDLKDLLTWLEYGRESDYVAARESKEQEEHWAALLRGLLDQPAPVCPVCADREDF